MASKFLLRTTKTNIYWNNNRPRKEEMVAVTSMAAVM
jgi:hypothetical protein